MPSKVRYGELAVFSSQTGGAGQVVLRIVPRTLKAFSPKAASSGLNWNLKNKSGQLFPRGRESGKGKKPFGQRPARLDDGIGSAANAHGGLVVGVEESHVLEDGRSRTDRHVGGNHRHFSVAEEFGGGLGSLRSPIEGRRVDRL